MKTFWITEEVLDFDNLTITGKFHSKEVPGSLSIEVADLSGFEDVDGHVGGVQAGFDAELPSRIGVRNAMNWTIAGEVYSGKAILDAIAAI